MREKIQDEYDAMMICREKVAQRGLPMQIVDAEYQWSVHFSIPFFYAVSHRTDPYQGSTQTHLLLQGGQAC